MSEQNEVKAVYIRLPADMAERIMDLADADVRSLQGEIIYLLKIALASVDKQPTP